MSKKNYIVDTKVVEKSVKDAEKVKAIQEKMKNLYQELERIKEDNRWLNYASYGADLGLTEDEAFKISEAHEILNYATDIRF